MLISPHPFLPRLPNEATSDQKPGSSRCQRPAQPWGGRGGRGARLRHPGDTHGDTPRPSVGSGRISRPPRRKPDKGLYVPKGTRRKGNWRERESDGAAAPGGENCPKNPTGDPQRELGKGGGSPGKLQEAEGENVPEEGGAEHPLRDGKGPSLGNSRDSWDKGCSHSPCSGHSQHPPEAQEQDPSSASSTIPENTEFQEQLQEENQASSDSRGWERGESSFPLENHAGSWTEPPKTQEPCGEAGKTPLENPESSRNKPEQNSQENPGSFSTLENPEQESLGAAQVEQKPLQNLLEGAGEAPGGDPGGKAPREEEEEEEEKESLDVALSRGLDLAAGDREGTRQSGLEDECTAELLAEVIWGQIWGKKGKESIPGRRKPNPGLIFLYFFLIWVPADRGESEGEGDQHREDQRGLLQLWGGSAHRGGPGPRHRDLRLPLIPENRGSAGNIRGFPVRNSPGAWAGQGAEPAWDWQQNSSI